MHFVPALNRAHSLQLCELGTPDFCVRGACDGTYLQGVLGAWRHGYGYATSSTDTVCIVAQVLR